MKIIGIESSGQAASVAVLEDDILRAEYTINYKKTHSQTLLPMLSEISKMIELDLQTVDAIAISAGPGSFTGLRIGSGTAKGLGQGLDKPLVEVPTLMGLAFNLSASATYVCPLMDARRNQAYTGVYSFETVDHRRKINTVVDQCAVDINEIIDKLNELQKPVTFLGDGVKVFRSVIEEKLTVPFDFAYGNNNEQRAGSVATLGMQFFKEGKGIPASEHQPEYLRKSQAEREADEKNAQ